MEEENEFKIVVKTREDPPSGSGADYYEGKYIFTYNGGKSYEELSQQMYKELFGGFWPFRKRHVLLGGTSFKRKNIKSFMVVRPKFYGNFGLLEEDQ